MDTVARSVYLTAGLTAAVLLGLTIQAVSHLPVIATESEAERAEQRRRLEVMCRISEERREAANELLAGRRTLSETAACFRQFTEDCPFDILPTLRVLNPGHSDEDLHYLHVLMFIRAECCRRGMGQERLEELQREFEAHKVARTQAD